MTPPIWLDAAGRIDREADRLEELAVPLPAAAPEARQHLPLRVELVHSMIWPWARLLRRVRDRRLCDRCAGPQRILGAVTEPDAVRRMLVALGLAAEPPSGVSVSAA